MKVTIQIEDNGVTQSYIGMDTGSGEDATGYSDRKEERNKSTTTEQEARYSIVSDLSNVCEYLSEADCERIRLIINKCNNRKGNE